MDMDVFSDLLRSLRVRPTFITHIGDGAGPSRRLAEDAALTLCMSLQGSAVVTTATSSVLLQSGGVAILRGPGTVSLPDPPDGPRSAVVLGEFSQHSVIGGYLLDPLPALLDVPCSEITGSLGELVSEELSAQRPGQNAVVEKMLAWLLICSLRAWLDEHLEVAPPWYRAASDPVTSPAVRAIHADPGRRWTVATLADQAGVSRATLAKRFSNRIGIAPLGYLTQWRMALATDLLRDTEEPITAIARQVGYADAFSFSTAFKRTTGQRPSAYRSARAGDHEHQQVRELTESL